MSKYTITIRKLMDLHFDFGLNDYPLYKEIYTDRNGNTVNRREEINNLLLSHYIDYEIGLETPELFKFYLNQAMNEIMPYYNEKLWSLDKDINDFNIFDNVKMEETFTHEVNNSNSVNSTSSNNNTSSGTSTGSNEDNGLSKEFSGVQEGMTDNELNNNKFLKSAQIDKSNSSNNSSFNNSSSNTEESTQGSTGNTKETYTRTNKGSSAGLPLSKAVQQYWEICESIPLEIITHEKIQECFIQIF